MCFYIRKTFFTDPIEAVLNRTQHEAIMSFYHHYENMPMLYTAIFLTVKKIIFR